jgi:cell division protein ZapE
MPSSQNPVEPQTPMMAYQARVRDGALKPDPAQEAAAQALQKLYENIIGTPQKPGHKWLAGLRRKSAKVEAPAQGLYIHGAVGRGKTMLMDIFYHALPASMRKRRVHFHAFMIDVHNYLHERREIGDFGDGVDGALPSLALRLAEQADVLCFDEFHVTDVADAMILGRLFTALFDRGVVVVATSNWPPDRLYEGGLQRDRFLPFIDLLKRRLQVVHLDFGIDYRTQFLASRGTYFWPLGDVTKAAMDELFAQLTDAAPSQEDIITVKGREIVAPQVAKGAARFSFAQLCERPHGAEDYLAIAQRYGTVFLESVPKMAYDRRNEAKRLMTLIDALYENNTKLIVSADAPPDKLYYGHDHGFEFQRTVSRLQEMQSEAYFRKSSRAA